MQLRFGVGVHERHVVDFSFDKFLGTLAILVDGVPVHKTIRFMSVSLVKSYPFAVGVQERHEVVITVTRKVFFAGFRPQLVQAYVDGQLVAHGTA